MDDLKICIKCNIEKEPSSFSSGRNVCIECRRKQRREAQREYTKKEENVVKIKEYLKNTKEIRAIKKKEYDKKYNEKNKEKKKEQSKRYREINKEKILESNKQRYLIKKESTVFIEKGKAYREKTKHLKKLYDKQRREKLGEELLIKKREYSRNNKEKINKYRRLQYKNNPELRLRRNVSSLVWFMLKKNGVCKNGSVLEYLPYSIEELKKHLESLFEPWMDWNNHGSYDMNKRTWQIDHIIPQALLPYDSMEHPNFIKCWSLENLRPLETIENARKGKKINHNPSIVLDN